VSAPSSPGSTACGIVRLLNTAGGRALVLAGRVDGPAVDSFHERYGREPARVDCIDAGSVTALSAAGMQLLRDHLDAARWSGRTVVLRPASAVERLLAGS
jgi:anti-anti-sigma regulatory factor